MGVAGMEAGVVVVAAATEEGMTAEATETETPEEEGGGIASPTETGAMAAEGTATDLVADRAAGPDQDGRSSEPVLELAGAPNCIFQGGGFAQ